MGHIPHGGNELIQVFLLVKSWLPPKKCITKHEPVLRAHGARRRGRGHKVAPGGCQAEGSWHPDGTACLPESGGDTSRLRDHRPCSSDCPMLRLSGAHKHSWLWGSPHTSTWKCKRATGPVTAVQMLGAGRHSPVWGSPRVGIRYRDTSLTVNCPRWVSGASASLAP